MPDIYMTVDAAAAAEACRKAYADSSSALEAYLEPMLLKAFAGPGIASVPFSVPHRVSNDAGPPLLVGPDGKALPLAGAADAPAAADTLVVPLRLDDTQAGIVVDEASLRELRSSVQGARFVGADLAFQGAYASAPAWSRGAGFGLGFGTRAAALRAVGKPFLDRRRLTGAGVNVVVADQGLDARALAGTFAGGWQVGARVPGQLEYVRGVTNNDHGMMIARNILAVAPGVRLFDLPLIPDRIREVESFLSFAQGKLASVLAWIEYLRRTGLVPGPWVLVNAWAIFDRSAELPPGSYSMDSSHAFNRVVQGFAEANIDVIFAAGNCGQFGPDPRCGIYDIGPGASIYGAHALASVLTLGALRADAQWAGTSSQGPGPEDRAGPSPADTRLTSRKPDLCAPSFFVDPHDGHAFNGGTSAASALAAGVTAALRGVARLDRIPTPRFFDALRRSARRAGAPLWDGRLGAGMIDAEGAFAALNAIAAAAPRKTGKGKRK